MKSNAKEKTETREYGREQEKLMSDLASKAMKNYEQAVRTGLKLQEEAAQMFSSFAGQTSSTKCCQERFAKLSSLASEALPKMQKNMDEALELAEKNNRKTMDLFRMAVDAAQTPTISESQSKWIDVWTESLSAARANIEAVTQLGNKALDSWVEYVRKNTDVTEVRIPKAAA